MLTAVAADLFYAYDVYEFFDVTLHEDEASVWSNTFEQRPGLMGDDVHSLRYCFEGYPWWRHQMETFSALLIICTGISPVTGELPAQGPVTRSFDVFFDLCLNKRLSKQSWGWWLETLPRSLWRHRNGPRLMKDDVHSLHVVSLERNSISNHGMSTVCSKACLVINGRHRLNTMPSCMDSSHKEPSNVENYTCHDVIIHRFNWPLWLCVTGSWK